MISLEHLPYRLLRIIQHRFAHDVLQCRFDVADRAESSSSQRFRNLVHIDKLGCCESNGK